MNSSSISWDERYPEKLPRVEPSELLMEFSAGLPIGGLALDLACGSGRNSVFLAQCGLRVVGVDRSREALEKGRELASQKRVTVSWIRADLDKFMLPAAAFEVIVCFYYRDPALYVRLRGSLRPGGWLFYQTFTREQLRFGVGPHKPAHLLEPAELLNAFGDWDLILYRETWVERGVAALVVRKPANNLEIHSIELRF